MSHAVKFKLTFLGSHYLVSLNIYMGIFPTGRVSDTPILIKLTNMCLLQDEGSSVNDSPRSSLKLSTVFRSLPLAFPVFFFPPLRRLLMQLE